MPLRALLGAEVYNKFYNMEEYYPTFFAVMLLPIVVVYILYFIYQSTIFPRRQSSIDNEKCSPLISIMANAVWLLFTCCLLSLPSHLLLVQGLGVFAMWSFLALSVMLSGPAFYRWTGPQTGSLARGWGDELRLQPSHIVRRQQAGLVLLFLVLLMLHLFGPPHAGWLLMLVSLLLLTLLQLCYLLSAKLRKNASYPNLPAPALGLPPLLVLYLVLDWILGGRLWVEGGTVLDVAVVVHELWTHTLPLTLAIGSVAVWLCLELPRTKALQADAIHALPNLAGVLSSGRYRYSFLRFAQAMYQTEVVMMYEDLILYQQQTQRLTKGLEARLNSTMSRESSLRCCSGRARPGADIEKQFNDAVINMVLLWNRYFSEESLFNQANTFSQQVSQTVQERVLDLTGTLTSRPLKEGWSSQGNANEIRQQLILAQHLIQVYEPVNDLIKKELLKLYIDFMKVHLLSRLPEPPPSEETESVPLYNVPKDSQRPVVMPGRPPADSRSSNGAVSSSSHINLKPSHSSSNKKRNNSNSGSQTHIDISQKHVEISSVCSSGLEKQSSENSMVLMKDQSVRDRAESLEMSARGPDAAVSDVQSVAASPPLHMADNHEMHEMVTATALTTDSSGLSKADAGISGHMRMHSLKEIDQEDNTDENWQRNDMGEVSLSQLSPYLKQRQYRFFARGETSVSRRSAESDESPPQLSRRSSQAGALIRHSTDDSPPQHGRSSLANPAIFVEASPPAQTSVKISPKSSNDVKISSRSLNDGKVSPKIASVAVEVKTSPGTRSARPSMFKRVPSSNRVSRNTPSTIFRVLRPVDETTPEALERNLSHTASERNVGHIRKTENDSPQLGNLSLHSVSGLNSPQSLLQRLRNQDSVVASSSNHSSPTLLPALAPDEQLTPTSPKSFLSPLAVPADERDDLDVSRIATNLHQSRLSQHSDLVDFDKVARSSPSVSRTPKLSPKCSPKLRSEQVIEGSSPIQQRPLRISRTAADVVRDVVRDSMREASAAAAAGGGGQQTTHVANLPEMLPDGLRPFPLGDEGEASRGTSPIPSHASRTRTRSATMSWL